MFPNVLFYFQSVSIHVQWSSDPRSSWWLSPGSQDHDHGLWSLRSDIHHTLQILTLMTESLVSSIHPPNPSHHSINTLLLKPSQVSIDCLHFCITLTIFLPAPDICSHVLSSANHQPEQCQADQWVARTRSNCQIAQQFTPDFSHS